MAVAQAGKEIESDSEWMTLAAAGEILGEDRLTVASRCIGGELTGKREANRMARGGFITLVSRESVMALKKKLQDGSASKSR
jgi:hypothetical protein